MHLPAAGAGGDHEEVEQGGAGPHVQDKDVAPLVVGGDSGGQTGPVEGTAERPGGGGGHRGEAVQRGGGVQVTSFRASVLPPEVCGAAAEQAWWTPVSWGCLRSLESTEPCRF